MPDEICSRCGGSGEVLIEDWEEYQGIPCRYPAGDEVDTCPVCGGTGIAPEHVEIPF